MIHIFIVLNLIFADGTHARAQHDIDSLEACFEKAAAYVKEDPKQFGENVVGLAAGCAFIDKRPKV